MASLDQILLQFQTKQRFTMAREQLGERISGLKSRVPRPIYVRAINLSMF